MAADAATPPGALVEIARAKVNLYLHVTGRRADGYHELDSLVVFADVGDRLSFEPAEALSLTAAGPFADALPTGADNLVMRAAEGLAAVAGVDQGAAIHIEKNLPVASGIGGGSADAAACLRGLMRLWRVMPAPDVLEALALELGADVPVCLDGGSVFVGGIGEQLTAAPPLPDCGLVLANPGVPVATAEVFRRRGDAFSRPMPFAAPPRDAAGLAAVLQQRRNDLAPAACALQPVIAETVDALAGLPGALLARMSGSGATCFALFADAEAATQAAETLQADHADWWVAAGRIDRGD